ncbi:unnamed protein product [Prunus armeniaca]|uniref:Uncharacterized protein n=1 Tax=Prunus armeniaca TaxID=36596 RepID=A0A6J5U9U6_PRUAR|nr:unnamed protein product [Prunus armeniaca]
MARGTSWEKGNGYEAGFCGSGVEKTRGRGQWVLMGKEWSKEEIGEVKEISGVRGKGGHGEFLCSTQGEWVVKGGGDRFLGSVQGGGGLRVAGEE